MDLPQCSSVHFDYAPSQWETTLLCNVVSHWLGAYTDWSLLRHSQSKPILLTCRDLPHCSSVHFDYAPSQWETTLQSNVVSHWLGAYTDRFLLRHSQCISLFYSPAGIYYSAVVSILFMRPANERRRYCVTSSLIGWAHTQIDPCYDTHSLSLFYSPAWIYHSAVVSILIMRPANERRRYYVTSSLIDWAHTQIDPSQSKPALLTCMDLPQCSSVLEGPPHTAMDQLWPFHGSGTPKSLGQPLDGLWRYSRKKTKKNMGAYW